MKINVLSYSHESKVDTIKIECSYKHNGTYTQWTPLNKVLSTIYNNNYYFEFFIDIDYDLDSTIKIRQTYDTEVIEGEFMIADKIIAPINSFQYPFIFKKE